MLFFKWFGGCYLHFGCSELLNVFCHLAECDWRMKPVANNQGGELLGKAMGDKWPLVSS